MAECSKYPWIESLVTDSSGTEKESASFTVNKEEPNGDFTGKFTVDGGQPEDISGNCSTTIWFEVTRGDTKYHYEGKMTKQPDDPDKLEVKNGTRTQSNVSLTNERGAQAQSGDSETTTPPLDAADDWIAEQGTTLLKERAKKS